eukprot:13522538-Alexandrium_andersonii.AAC.1
MPFKYVGPPGISRVSSTCTEVCPCVTSLATALYMRQRSWLASGLSVNKHRTLDAFAGRHNAYMALVHDIMDMQRTICVAMIDSNTTSPDSRADREDRRRVLALPASQSGGPLELRRI